MANWTIAEAARKAGVGVDTLLYYERRGVLPAPARDRSNYRRYSAEAVRRVRFIRQAQCLGFTLNEIARLLDLHPRAAAECRSALASARSKIEEIDRKIAALRTVRAALGRLADSCEGGTPSAGGCPILSAFEGPEENTE